LKPLEPPPSEVEGELVWAGLAESVSSYSWREGGREGGRAGGRDEKMQAGKEEGKTGGCGACVGWVGLRWRKAGEGNLDIIRSCLSVSGKGEFWCIGIARQEKKKEGENKYPTIFGASEAWGRGCWPHTHDTTHTNTNPTRQGSPPDGETNAIL